MNISKIFSFMLIKILKNKDLFSITQIISISGSGNINFPPFLR